MAAKNKHLTAATNQTHVPVPVTNGNHPGANSNGTQKPAEPEKNNSDVELQPLKEDVDAIKKQAPQQPPQPSTIAVNESRSVTI